MAYFQPKSAGPNAPQLPSYTSNPFLYGFVMDQLNDTQFTLSPGVARAYATDALISYYPSGGSPNVFTMDISTTGAFGCYPVPLASFPFDDDTSFGVYVLGDTSGINPTVAIIATGDNFLLPGYDSWRCVNRIYVNYFSFTLIGMMQSGESIQREFVLNEITSAAVYGPTSGFRKPLSTGSGPCNPKFATDAYFTRKLQAATVTDASYLAPTSAFGDNSIGIQSPSTTGAILNQAWVPVTLDSDGNSCIYITVVGAGSQFTVSLSGWREYMGLNAI